MSDLIYEKKDGVAILTMNRPERRNAFSPKMMVQMAEAWADFAKDDSLRVAILTGTGDLSFSSGADLQLLIPLLIGARKPETEWDQKLIDDRGLMNQAMLRNTDLYKPIIAAVNGFALGGGFELALSCDYIIASNNAKFGLPEVSLGLIPGFGGTQRLTRCVGKGIASRIILSGEMVDASQALQWGITTQVCEPEVLLEVSLTQAQLIVSRSSSAQALAKRAIHQGFDLAQKDGELLEAQLFQEAFSSAHKREGIAAFIEKRKPTFD